MRKTPDVLSQLTRLNGARSKQSRCFDRTGKARSHRKYRRANARPEPDFKYHSNVLARSTSENSIVVTSFQGRPLAVCFESPALCAARRACTSDVSPV